METMETKYVICFLQAMHSAGIDGEQVILLLEDYQLGDVSSGYLDMVNSLLSSGEVTHALRSFDTSLFCS